MGTYVGGELVSAAGSRLIANPSWDQTRADPASNQANVRNQEAVREMINEGRPGTPYTQKEINERYSQMNDAQKQMQDFFTDVRHWANNQTESQVIFSVPGDDKMVRKTGDNKKDFKDVEKKYNKLLDNRNRAAAKGDKPRITYWNNQARNLMEQHMGRNRLAGNASMVASGFFGLNTLQKDLKDFQGLANKITKASSGDTAYNRSNSPLNKAVSNLLKHKFGSDQKNIPKFVKKYLSQARSLQRTGLGKGKRRQSNIKTREKKGAILNNLAGGITKSLSTTNGKLERQRRFIQAGADRQGIPWRGVTQGQINATSKRAASRVNRVTGAQPRDSDAVRASAVNRALRDELRIRKQTW